MSQKRFFIVTKKIIVLCMFLCLTACGREDDRRQYGIDGYVYVAEKLCLNDYIQNIKVFGEYVFYQIDGKLYKTPLETVDLTDGEEVLSCKVLDYALGKNGDIYYVKGNYGEQGILFLKPSGDGDEKELLNSIIFPVNFQGKGMTLKEEGPLFLLTESSICVIEGEDAHIARISTEEFKQGQNISRQEILINGEAGKMYYCVADGLYWNIYEIVKGTSWKIEKTAWGDRIYSEGFYESSYGLLMNDGDGLLQYSSNNEVPVKIMRWQDSNLQACQSLVQIDENRLLGFFLSTFVDNDCEDINPATGMIQANLLTKTSTKDLPKKEVLVLISKDPFVSLERAVAAFNQTSECYHVIIETYEEDARLDAEIMSKNSPDLFDMSGVDIMKYADKGVLEDLFPYLSRSDCLNKEDFLQNVLEGYTIENKLICIPDSFYFRAIMGRASQVGQKNGWRMEDCFKLADKYPGSRLFDTDDFEFILDEFCSDYILETYVDWDKKTCNFHDGNFQRLLDWIEENSGKTSEKVSDYVPEDALLVRKYISSFMNFEENERKFGDKIVIIGNPTFDGHPLHMAKAFGEIGILENSKYKDGAWEFLEFMLNQNSLFSGFSVRKDFLEEQLKKEEMIYKKDQNGKIMVNIDGESLKGWKGSFYLDGKEEDYYGLTQEQMDEIMGVIETVNFHPRGLADQEIFNIIMEEVNSARSGDKSFEEVCAIIQKRVYIVIQESQMQ